MHKKILSDSEILDLIKYDPSAGMKRLMDDYSGLVYYIVNGKLNGRQQDVEECVSDVFVEFYNKIDEMDLDKGSIKAYLATMAARRGIDYFRKQAGRDNEDIDEFAELRGDEGDNPENSILETERRQKILQAVKDLGEPDSTIIFRRYFLGQQVKEIAEDLDMKGNSVTKRISRALETLKSGLEEFYFG